MPPVKMKGDGRMARDPKKTLSRLLSYMRKYIPVLIIVLLPSGSAGGKISSPRMTSNAWRSWATTPSGCASPHGR